MLEPSALRAAIDEGMVEARRRVTERFGSQVGSAALAAILGDFAGTLDLEQFGNVPGRPYAAWLSHVVRRPESGDDRSGARVESLQARVEQLTARERSSLTKLVLQEGAGLLRDLSPLERIPRLRRLDLSAAQLLADLGPLAALKELEELVLPGSHVVDDLRPLASLPLERLRLGRVQCDLTPIADLRSIRGLELQWNAGASGFPALGEMASLRVLVLHKPPSDSLEAIWRLTGLVQLELYGDDLTDLRGVGRLRALQKLVLMVHAGADVRPIADLRALRELSLWNTQVWIAPIARLPRLESLSLMCVELETLDGLQAARGLRRLEVSATGLRDVAALSGLTALENISLDGRFADLAPLAGLRNLKDLALDSPELCDLSPLAGLTRLRFIDVIACGRLQSLLPLAECPALEEILCDEGGRLRGPKSLAELRSRRGGVVVPIATGLRVQVDKAGAGGQAAAEMDLRAYLPAPLPAGWRVDRGGEPEDVSCTVVLPYGTMVARIQLEEGSDRPTLAVAIFAAEGAVPHVGDERARAWLQMFRVRGVFEEKMSGTGDKGMRMFVARV